MSSSHQGSSPHIGPTAAVLTLGCKVNQFESAAIAEILKTAGYHIVTGSEAADLRVINTCTVTHRADFEVRALARRVHRLNPKGRTVITGCMAQLRPRELLELPGVVLITGQEQKDQLLELLAPPIPDTGPVIQVTPPGLQVLKPLGYPGFERTRAFFRIQDGCNGCCAYCTIPQARGPSRSLDLEQVREGMARYAREGYLEVVLTGIHLGFWGVDQTPRTDLTALVEALVQTPPPPRLRLSSIEPNEITDRIIALMAACPEHLCPHLHLPLQSGSDVVLRAMRRPYDTALFRDLVFKLKKAMPHMSLGTDVLVGFPGEDDARFQETRAFLADLPLTYFHVFPFSVRPGVPAAAMPGRVPDQDIKQRASILRKMSSRKKARFQADALGQVRPTLIEHSTDKTTGLPTGITDHYIRVLVNGPATPGTMAMVKLVEVSAGGRVSGQVIETDGKAYGAPL